MMSLTTSSFLPHVCILFLLFTEKHYFVVTTRHDNSVACSSVTKGDPFFNNDAMHVVPAPVHNTLGIVGKSCQELDAFYCALDDEGQTHMETRQRKAPKKEVERLQLVVEGKECAAKAHHDALQQGMAELTALREIVEDKCNDVASEAIAARDRMGDRFLVRAEGYEWLPTHGEGGRQRERRALWGDVATQNELPEKEEEVPRLKTAHGIAYEAQQIAKRELHEAELSYNMVGGMHMQAYKAALAHFGISKTAYLGHAYIGKYRKLLKFARNA